MRRGVTGATSRGWLLCLLALVPLAGCASSEAEPLEVTYYYLPG